MEKVLSVTIADKKPIPVLTEYLQLAQNANCLHQSLHAKDHKDLHFDLAEDFLPEDFYFALTSQLIIVSIFCLQLTK